MNGYYSSSVVSRLLPAELRTERLLLRQFRPDDAEALHEIYVQPEYLEHMPVSDLDGARAQIERFARMWDDDGHGQWAAEECARRWRDAGRSAGGRRCRTGGDQRRRLERRLDRKQCARSDAIRSR